MTCCAICKITLGKSIEEGECGCPKFFKSYGEWCIAWRGYTFRLFEFDLIQRSGNPNVTIPPNLGIEDKIIRPKNQEDVK